MKHRLTQTCISLVVSLTSSVVLADWRDDVGWDELQEWANLRGVTLPVRDDLTVGMVESSTYVDSVETTYMPDPQNGNFSDETIVDVPGTNGAGYSGHASTVARYFFGNTTSFTPDVNEVRSYGVNAFINTILFRSTGWDEAVMSHAYIGNLGAFQTYTQQEVTDFIMASIDQQTNVSNVINIVGTGNSSGSALSGLFSFAHNNLTIGISEGTHTSGQVPAGYEGANRQKPELVNPQGATSYATGAVASMALYLRYGVTPNEGEETETAEITNSEKALTIKSILLAGANKLPFVDWSNSKELPLDSVYGAGESNILNSYRILHAGEQEPGLVSRYGWNYDSVGGTAVGEVNMRVDVYEFTIPETAHAGALSANLSWNRDTTGTGFATAYLPLNDLSLTLNKSDGSEVYQSDSKDNNLEHIWQPELAPGNYTLRVEHQSSSPQEYVLAWRVDLYSEAPESELQLGVVDNQIQFTGLLPNEAYVIRRSQDLNSWSQLATITSNTQGEIQYTDAGAGSGSQYFYQARCYPD
ncbi:hypothetical protein [Rubritalea marina]|uniref:hypothetical protein n=1 Tax=Rubritalea marina TaxID=361055 RepID=UPI000377ADCE|nr:hypothetical protein [Rubritalea marina]